MAKAKKTEEESGPSTSSTTSPSEALVAQLDLTKVVLVGLVILLALLSVGIYSSFDAKLARARAETLRTTGASATPVAGLRDFRVVNGHDHLYMVKHLDKYLAAAAKTGIDRTLFVASSEFTLKGKGHDPTKGNDWNTQEVLRAAKKHPDKVIPFCTIHPSDPKKLERLKGYVAAGIKGLKLYTGHGNFWDRPLDAEEMMPVYAYCEEIQLPICWHVNFPRYGDEFARVMLRFPKLVVIVPHWGVTFYRPTQEPFQRFQEMISTYPNLYTDTSFGTRAILVHGLEVVSEHPEIFRAFFEKYSDRTLFGTDMVVTGNKEKTPEWIEAVLRACRDVLEKDRYHFFMAAKGSGYALKRANNTYGELRGLTLSDEILRKVYETNCERLFPSE